MLPRFARFRSLVGVILAGASLLRAAPTATEFFRRPDLTSPSVSKDGRYVAYLTRNNKKYYDLNLFDFTKREPLKFDLKGDDIMGYYWLDETQLVVTTEKPPIYSWRQIVFDVNRRTFTHNLTYSDVRYRIISAIKDRPGLFYAYFPVGAQRNQPEINVIDSRKKTANLSGLGNSRFNVVEGFFLPAEGEYHGGYVDQRGEIRVVLLYQNGDLHFHFRAIDGSWTRLPLNPKLDEIMDFTDDPNEFYLTRRDPQTGASSLHRYNASRKELGPALFSDAEYALDQSRVLLSENGKELLGLHYLRDRTNEVAFSPVLKAVQARANQVMPGRSNIITSYDEKLSRFIVMSLTDRNIRYLIYDRSNDAFSGLADPHPQLPPESLQPVRVVHFPSRDGLNLEGYLTLPAAGTTKPPLVVLPHGGPWVRDEWGLDAQAQFLTSRGYAVFQPNYRGSTGYTKEISLDGEFAFRKMHDDVTDGVRYLISTGLIDATRIGIFGGSFGGYLALCGVAFEPDLYRCAITFAGVFDWKRLIAQRRGTAYDHFNYDVLVKNLGDPGKSTASFEEISPINHISGIKVPVFVAHGKEDERVDISQSKKLLAELEKYHVPAETMFIAGEGHGFDELENKVKFEEALEAFLAKHLMAAPHGKN